MMAVRLDLTRKRVSSGSYWFILKEFCGFPPIRCRPECDGCDVQVRTDALRPVA